MSSHQKPKPAHGTDGYGQAGNDVLTVSGSDLLWNGGIVATNIESFRLYGGNGNDTLTGGAAYSELFGGYNDDTITLGSGGGYASGDAGDDFLIGSATNDYLRGSYGSDTMTGGGGADTFAFVSYETSTGYTDVITDFEVGPTCCSFRA